MKTQRLYSLFEITTLPNGRKRYTRLTTFAFPKARAVHIFQDMLLAPMFIPNLKARELRPVKQEASR